MMDNQGMQNGMMCKCSHHKMVPLLIVLFALAFLLKAFNVLTEDFVNVAWPVLVGAAGVLKLCERGCKCC